MLSWGGRWNDVNNYVVFSWTDWIYYQVAKDLNEEIISCCNDITIGNRLDRMDRENGLMVASLGYVMHMNKNQARYLRLGLDHIKDVNKELILHQ